MCGSLSQATGCQAAVETVQEERQRDRQAEGYGERERERERERGKVRKLKGLFSALEKYRYAEICGR